MCASLHHLNQQALIVISFLSIIDVREIGDGSDADADAAALIPLVAQEWVHKLFGIFSYDNPAEHELYAANRETHLTYFRLHPDHDDHGAHPESVCSLGELIRNATLARDAGSCRLVYIFVMGEGGENTGRKVTGLEGGGGVTRGAEANKTRCLWEDPECGGTDVSRWTLCRRRGGGGGCLLSDSSVASAATFDWLGWLSDIARNLLVLLQK